MLSFFKKQVTLVLLLSIGVFFANAQTAWTIRTTPADNTWRSVTFGNNTFVAVASSGTGNRVMTSPDGITWTSRNAAVDNDWLSVTFGNGLFVATAGTGTGNRVMTSPDGITWTSRTSAIDHQWYSVAYANNLFVAVASSGTVAGNRVMTSPDGINWTLRSTPNDNTWSSITFGNGLFVVTATSGTGDRIMTSPNGIDWTLRTSPADNNWWSVKYGNGKFVAVASSGTGNRVMTSADGINWTIGTTPADNFWFSVTYGKGLFVATSVDGAGNRVMTSPDGITWTLRTSAADNAWRSITYTGEIFVAVANTGTGNRVMTSGTLTFPNALHFAGTDAQIVDDQIVVPHNAAFNVNAFTMEAWVKEDNNTSNNIFSKGGGNGVQNDGSYIFYVYQNKLGFYTRNQLHFFDTAVLCPNVWSHVAATYDGVSTLRFYVNGTPTKVFTNLTGPLQSPGTGPLGIGVQGPLGSPQDPCNCNRFQGSMDEVRMWNVARTQAEINTALKTELVGNESGLVGYWKFNQGNAGANNAGLTTALDASSNGNNGTLQGFSLNGSASNWVSTNSLLNSNCTAEIEVKGNDIGICSGDATPSATDNTDWGNVALGSKQTKEFNIRNIGTTTLNITGYSITGTHASDYAVLFPSAPFVINAGNASQLLIDCTPDAFGTRTATLNIFTNDCDEAAFSFALQATSCTPTLANSGDSRTTGFWGNNNFLATGTCRVIADLSSYSFQGNPVLAKVTIDGSVQTYTSVPYVQRHYDIEPSVNASSRTATVSLYFTQTEFTNFNAHPNSGLDLPTGAGDAIGIANLRITQYHGVGTAPGNYSGAAEIINPTDANIIWQAAYSRWKVTFTVTGFSGFYVHTGNAILGAASALNFDGANDYVVIPRLDFSASNVMTIEAWIKPTNITTNQFYEISRQQIAAINPPDWLLSFQNNGTILSFGTRTSTGYNELDIPISAANYVDGNWHHIAAVYDGVTKKIYRDGVLLGQNNFTGNLIYSPTAVNLIGNSAEVYNEPFNGSMDEVRLWNRALPQCEILNNMNCELAAGQTNLMAYYQFNQGFDGQNNAGVTSLTDASGNSRTGTLTNFVLTGTTSNWVNPGGVVTGTTCTIFVPLSATSSQANVTPCFGGNNGSATVVPSGGFGGYTYSWSPSGGTAATATGLTAGSYTCTITSGGCVITRNFIITQPAAIPTPVITAGGSTTFCAGNNVLLTISPIDLNYTSTTIGTAGLDQWQSFTPNVTGSLYAIIVYTNGTPAGTTSTFTLYSGVGTAGVVLNSQTVTVSGANTSFVVNLPNISLTASNNYTFRFQNVTTTFLLANNTAPGSYFSTDYGLNPGWKLNFTTLMTPSLLATQWFNNGTLISGETANTYSATTTSNYTAVRGLGTCSSPVSNSVVVTVNANTLATNAQTITQDITNTILSTASCILIANVVPNGSNPITGNVNGKVWIETTQPAQFVKRHYEITPATGASTATGRVTLYFTQAEFNDFNAVSTTDLPTGSSDAAGKANLLIEKRPGISSDGTGLPNTYTGTPVTINPNDADIVWNSTNSRWEVTFDVTGFSGFFVKTIGFVLPIKLISFTAQSLNNRALVNWGIAQPESGIKYSLERSTNGVNFYTINNQVGNITNKLFSYTDYNLADGKYYYRLKIIDVDGKISYSNIVHIIIGVKNMDVSIYPNPVPKGNSIEVTLGDTKLLNWRLVNAIGQVVAQQQNINASNKHSITLLTSTPTGVYQLQLNTNNGVKNKRVIIQ